MTFAEYTGSSLFRAAGLINWRLLVVSTLVIISAAAAVAAQVSATPQNEIFTVDDAPEMEVIAYGKTVVVKQRAKGVLTFGGDAIIEGRVEGDVAAIGGNVIQKNDAYIGGDVFVIGGKYQPENVEPLRGKDKETVMIAGYEEELRALTADPSSILTPAFSPAFLAQRALSVLFWFLVSLGFATIAPGAVSRAAARFQLSAAKVLGIGMAGFLLTSIGTIICLSLLPNYISAAVGLMAFSILILAYVFGRIVLHVATGKLLQKFLMPNGSRSEALAIFAGVLCWTIMLSIPYLWIFALIALFAAGIGLVATARRTASWQRT